EAGPFFPGYPREEFVVHSHHFLQVSVAYERQKTIRFIGGQNRVVENLRYEHGPHALRAANRDDVAQVALVMAKGTLVNSVRQRIGRSVRCREDSVRIHARKEMMEDQPFDQVASSGALAH